ncbi:MAG: YggS family pyridoxal phosphate-dependent enzyme [Rhodothalassiaceae bacterium]
MAIDPVANLAAVQSAMAEACRRFGVVRDLPQVVAVSKVHGAERIVPLLAAGHRHFGENRVQEAQAKWPDLKARHPGTVLHLLGPLQTNKVSAALDLFDVIETLDREKLARKLAEALKTRTTAPRLFVQVNTGEEAQKSGVLPGDLAAFLDLCRDTLGLPICGLMCIPPMGEDPALHFGLLKTLADRHGVNALSMGMSGDYPLAAAMGADFVRVGTAIFGPRDQGAAP